MVSALEKWNDFLSKIEKSPVPINSGPETKIGGNFNKSCSELAAEVEKLRQTASSLNDPTSKQELTLLSRQRVALTYRYKLSQPSLPPFEQLRTDFSQVLTRYKQNQELYPGGGGQLTEMDEEQIEEACLRFPAAVTALIQRNPSTTSNDPWTTAFVKFCLRSPGASQISARHWVRIFFELPQQTDELMRSTLDKRLGATDPGLIQILRLNGIETLCIKVSGVWYEIQGSDTTAKLPNCVNKDHRESSLSVSEIYQQMREKKFAYNQVEVFQRVSGNPDCSGILNWDAAELGSVDPATGQVDRIDVTKKGWMCELPIWRSMELHEVQKRYPIRWPDETPHTEQFALVMCASRIKPTLDISDNHAYFEVVVPEPSQPGRFRILPFGFQAPVLPATDVDRLLAIQQTQRCILHYPDESAYLSQREHYKEWFTMSSGEFFSLQDALAHFVEKSRAGKEVFQPTGSNCGKHAQKLFDTTLGQRFYAPFEALATSVLQRQDIHDQIKRITKGLDDRMLKSLSSELVETLFNRQDFVNMGKLLSLCLNTLSYTLKGEEEIEAYKISPEEAERQVQILYQLKNANIKLILTELIEITVHSHQFYKISIFDVEVGNPILGPIFRFIQGIEWEWLRSLLFRGLCFVLGSWRGYSYQKSDGSLKTARIWSHPLHGHDLNLPAQAFNRPMWKQQTIQRISSHFLA